MREVETSTRLSLTGPRPSGRILGPVAQEDNAEGETLKTGRRDAPSSPRATATMRANRGRDTQPELALRAELFRSGLRFRKNMRLDLPNGRVRPDIVFPGVRLAVFVDGCFWHGCPLHAEWPRSNADFWVAKIEGNRARDAKQDAVLRSAGWAVLRFWEHDPISESARRIQEEIAARKGAA